MGIELDETTGAPYFQVTDDPVVHESVEWQPDVYLDVDEQGDVIGAEFLVASDFFDLIKRNDGQFSTPNRLAGSHAA